MLIRECPEGEDPSKWYPVGGMAVPRSSSIDVALSIAIFNNEDDLLRGAFRSYPFLSKSEHKFECTPRRARFRRRLARRVRRAVDRERLTRAAVRAPVRGRRWLSAQGVSRRPGQGGR